jgi:hypothetical protein
MKDLAMGLLIAVGVISGIAGAIRLYQAFRDDYRRIKESKE